MITTVNVTNRLPQTQARVNFIVWEIMGHKSINKLFFSVCWICYMFVLSEELQKQFIVNLSAMILNGKDEGVII